MSSRSKAKTEAPKLGSRVSFYPLRISERREEIGDSCSFRFEVPDELAELFRHRPGQHLALRARLGDTEHRRTYSLCGDPDESRVLIKRVDGGLFSNHALDRWSEDDLIEVMPPQGQFGLKPDSERSSRYLAIAGGCGITPVIAIIESLLASEPHSLVTLLYANRSTASIIFRERLADLKNVHMERFALFHILSRESSEEELLHGRIDEAKLADLAPLIGDFNSFDHVFTCGPDGLAETVRNFLGADFTGKIHSEQFTVDRQISQTQNNASGTRGTAHCCAKITIDGLTHQINVAADQTILDAASASGLELPFSCRGGVCGTCRALLVEGKVSMLSNHALEEDERERGFVLACQSVAQSDELALNFDRV